jgi:uncharacterized protein (DUF885 family)
MTPDELAAFLAEVRAQVDEISARLEALDPATLPPEAQATYDDTRRQVQELRMLTETHVLALLEDACLRAGRELSAAELRGLLGLH